MCGRPVATFYKTLADRRDGRVDHDQALAKVPATFAELVEQNSRFAFRVAYVVLRNVEDAEDVVQETFLKLFRTGGWKVIRDERAFLAQATWRMAVDRLRKRYAVAVDLDIVSPGPTPEAELAQADWTAVLHRLMAALPEDLRLPLGLSAMEELNSREIAEVLGIPEGTVRHRISMARKMLKQKLAALETRRHEA